MIQLARNCHQPPPGFFKISGVKTGDRIGVGNRLKRLNGLPSTGDDPTSLLGKGRLIQLKLHSFKAHSVNPGGLKDGLSAW